MMPFDQELAFRLEKVVTQNLKSVRGLTETRMMGGFGYFLNGNMCIGIHKDTLMIRVGQQTAERIIQQPLVREMDFTGKVMKAWATVESGAIKTDQKLIEFCQLSIDFVSSLPAKENKKE